MANIKSAKKRVLVSATKHERNRVVRAAVKTRVVRVRKALDSGSTEGTMEDIFAAVSALDKAAERGILHRRNASRRKSRLMRAAAKVAKLAADPEAAAQAAADARSHAKGSGKTRAGGKAAGRGAAKSAPKTPRKTGK
ncbi:MAG: small subunit ribosomal protein [Chloroflexota bacterium]|jgi:small subunit ribosomal protein S20|nr:small subunit ribosomal protein [Chloroflexota bacterium]